jgi:hypothetical protein
MRFSGHIYSMWTANLNLLDPKFWCPYTIQRAVISNRLFPFSAPLICRLFDILQSFVQHCKVHTHSKNFLKGIGIFTKPVAAYVWRKAKERNKIQELK